MGFNHFWDNDKKSYKYSSLLINLPESLCDDIISWGFDYIPNEKLISNPKIPSFGREDDTHITLLYGIHTENPKSFDFWISYEKPFECKLGKIDILTKSNYFDVLVVSVDSEELHKLNSKLRQVIEYTDSFYEYIPHVTIAYINKGTGKQYVGDTTFEGINFDVNEVVFNTKKNNKYLIPLGAT